MISKLLMSCVMVIIILFAIRSDSIAIDNNFGTHVYVDEYCRIHIKYQIGITHRNNVGIDSLRRIRDLVKSQLESCLLADDVDSCCARCSSDPTLRPCRIVIDPIDIQVMSEIPEGQRQFYHEIEIIPINGYTSNGTMIPANDVNNRKGKMELAEGDLNRRPGVVCHELMHLSGVDDRYCDRWSTDPRLNPRGYRDLKCEPPPDPNGGTCCTIPPNSPRCVPSPPCPNFENSIMAKSSNPLSCRELLELIKAAGVECPTRCCDCDISGPQFLYINQTAEYPETPFTDGYWVLVNHETCAARIVIVTDVSVVVNSGPSRGKFQLRYMKRNCDNTYAVYCEYLVTVDFVHPVEMSSFVSSTSNNNIHLSWATASELNNSGFDIERSTDKIVWSRLAFVEGNGTLNVPSEYRYIDKNLATGKYNYRLKQIDFNGNFEYFELPEAVTIGVPDKFFLEQNYPNPFNPVTTIAYGIPEAGNVKLKVFDMSGKEIKTLINEFKDAGYYTAKFDASGLASGAYVYRIESGNFVSVMKMVFLK
jgi:hypothetical protein